MSEDEDLARAIALSLQDSSQSPPYASEQRIVNDHEDDDDDEEEGHHSCDEYVRYVERVKHLQPGEDEGEGESESEDEDEDDDEDEDVADEYEEDENPYEEVLDDFDGFDTYTEYIENLRRRHEDEANDARFRADLARAIAASKATAPPTTFIAPLTPYSAPNQVIGPAAAEPSTVATQSRSAVLGALERSAFLADRPALDLERLERLKRRRGDPHGAEPPHSKRPTPPTRTANCAPASQDNPRRKGKEVGNDPGEGRGGGVLGQRGTPKYQHARRI